MVRPNPQWRRYLLVVASAVICYSALGVVLRIVPGYVSSGLHANPVWVGLIVGAPALTGAACRPIGGRFADRRGPRVVMIFGSVVMAAGTAPAFAPDLGGLLVSRLLVGVGEALMMSAAVLWLLRLAGPDRQALALGHIGLANYAGLTVGPLIAGLLGGERHPSGVFAVALALPLLAIAAVWRQPVPAAESSGAVEPDDHRVWTKTWRPGIGLLCVNVGYVAVLAFGASVATTHHIGVASYVLPVFAGGVIASRTVFGAVPDRVGAGRTLAMAASLEAVGLVAFGLVTSTAVAVLALVVLSVGQGLAVPALGALALRDVPPQRRGAAAGTFFAYFDAGVGLGGPFTGAVAHAFAPSTSIVVAGVVVMAATPVALARRSLLTRLRYRDGEVPAYPSASVSRGRSDTGVGVRGDGKG